MNRDGVVRQAEVCVGNGQEVWINGRDRGYWERLGRGPDAGIIVLVDGRDAHHARVLTAGVFAPAPRDMVHGPDRRRHLWLQRKHRGHALIAARSHRRPRGPVAHGYLGALLACALGTLFLRVWRRWL
jgi:hypothetical protein